jgi:hypothetical protein
MHRSEAEELVVCKECGAEVAITDRVFLFDDDVALCYGCSVARGGVYDERHDQWESAPDVTDLLASEA